MASGDYGRRRSTSRANAINDSGQIVGVADDQDGTTRAVRFDR
jgi:hypothetical protein